MDEAGVKENALGGGGFAGVDVRGDADVARALHRILPVGRIRPVSVFVFYYCFHLKLF